MKTGTLYNDAALAANRIQHLPLLLDVLISFLILCVSLRQLMVTLARKTILAFVVSMLFLGSIMFADGLLWSDADLAVWKTRAVQGPYKSDGDSFDSLVPGEWERITESAETFRSDPSVDRLNSYTVHESASALTGDVYIQNHKTMVDAAFYALVAEDTELADAVKDELLWHARNENLQISPDQYQKTDYGNWWNSAWVLRMLSCADFVKDRFSSSERAEFDAWIQDFAYSFEYSVHYEISQGGGFGNRALRDYDTRRGYASVEPSFDGTYAYKDANGDLHNQIAWIHKFYNNRRAGVMQFVGLSSVWLDDDFLIDRAKLYVEEWLKFSVFPDGSVGEYERNNLSGNIQQGYIYNGYNLEMAVTLADAMARAGDTALYEFETYQGIWGTESEDGDPAKSIKLVVETQLALMEDRLDWYFSETAVEEKYRIDHTSETGSQLDVQWNSEIYFAPMGNRYWKDADILKSYTRSAEGSIPYASELGSAGPYGGPWRGHQATFPSMLFMFAEMEQQTDAYGVDAPAGSLDDSTSVAEDLVTEEPAVEAEDSVLDQVVESEDDSDGFSFDMSGYRESDNEGVLIFGLDPTWASISQFEAVFDGSADSFYDYYYTSASFAGFDAGESLQPTEIHFTPRTNFASRMVGGVFQGSNESSTSGYVTLYTVESAPEYEDQVIQLDITETYRYYRYVSPDSGYGNIAEFSIDFATSVEVELTEDSLPDEWELLYFGGLDATLASEEEDFDGDLVSNYDEWVAGTDPTDATDFLSLEPALGVTWKSQLDRSYRIEYSDDNWVSSALSESLVGDGSMLVWVDPAARDVQHNRQYRILVVNN
jgi:hypothetical protein